MAFNVVQNIFKANVFGHFWGKVPQDADGGVRPKGLPVPITFDGTAVAQMVDITAIVEDGAIETVQSAWIDNYGGATYIEATIQSTGQRFRIAPSSGAYIVLPFPQGRLLLTRGDAGEASVIFYNVPIPPQSLVQGSGGVASAVTISNPLGLAAQAVGVSVTQSTIARTPALVRATGAGSVAAGAAKVSIANIGAANGVVLGVAVEPGINVAFEANGNDTISAIAYDATGTTFLISTLT